ncbi:cytochrome P450 [Arthrobacter pigmenti]|uniref:Cytochrome P450 n=1 Tax=Arthrobacter pigmenti TaxID=271432 RepID=A0A846RG40_9MICC|nr:cytochrome P450 [Arthrobacter pigmenti]NJC22168.1 cytochrome P450 [Arthrobacter pigmenti]
MDTRSLDLADKTYRTDPFPTYRMLRTEHPVHFLPEYTSEGEDVYMLSRYHDVNNALKNTNMYSSHVRRDDYLDLPMMVNRDAPDHRRMRHYTNQALNARRITSMAPWIRELVGELVGEVLSSDRVEFVEGYSTMLPLRVISVLLGVPLDRRRDLRRWSQAVMDFFSVAAGLNPDEVPGFFEDLVEFGNYIEEQAQARENNLTDDVLSKLVEGQLAGELTKDELIATGWSFVAAGHETTMNLLGGGILLLTQRHDLRAALRNDPSQLGDFIEEYLRLYSPTQWTARRAVVSHTLHGIDIPEGALVHVLLGSADRDETVFHDPDEFKLGRSTEEKHLAFGGGPHFCPGAALSRVMAEETFAQWLPHLDRLHVDPADPPRLRERQGSFGYAYLPFVVSHATADEVSV